MSCPIAQVSSAAGLEAYRSAGWVEKSLALFRLQGETDPAVLEDQLLRTPPNVMFARGLGAADVGAASTTTVTATFGMDLSGRSSLSVRDYSHDATECELSLCSMH
jgi:hypothetical protein